MQPPVYESHDSVTSAQTVPVTRDITLSKKPPSLKRLLQNGASGERALLLLRLAGQGEIPVTMQQGDRFILGRKDSDTAPFVDVDFNAYFARERGVSRSHAALYMMNNTVSLVDLGSSNGTFLNGKKLIPHIPRVLHDGDNVQLGKLMFTTRFIR